MAIKPTKKSVAKTSAKPKSKPAPTPPSKSKVTKSRGSKLAVQVGNQNQLEDGRVKSKYGYNPKISSSDIAKGLKQAAKDKQVGTDMGLASDIKLRTSQRSGGGKNLSEKEQYASRPGGKGPGKTRPTVKKNK